MVLLSCAVSVAVLPRSTFRCQSCALSAGEQRSGEEYCTGMRADFCPRGSMNGRLPACSGYVADARVAGFSTWIHPLSACLRRD